MLDLHWWFRLFGEEWMNAMLTRMSHIQAVMQNLLLGKNHGWSSFFHSWVIFFVTWLLVLGILLLWILPLFLSFSDWNSEHTSVESLEFLKRLSPFNPLLSLFCSLVSRLSRHHFLRNLSSRGEEQESLRQNSLQKFSLTEDSVSKFSFSWQTKINRYFPSLVFMILLSWRNPWLDHSSYINLISFCQSSVSNSLQDVSDPSFESSSLTPSRLKKVSGSLFIHV
jgi:hypothetical protein